MQIYFKNFFLINLKNIIFTYLGDILFLFSNSDLKEENTLNYEYSQFKKHHAEIYIYNICALFIVPGANK